MTLDEATAHVGNPVLIHHSQGHVDSGEITFVDKASGMVKVKVRRRTHPYDFLLRRQSWHPVHLTVPAYWLDRQKEPERTS